MDPATIGQFFTKQLKCQSLHCGRAPRPRTRPGFIARQHDFRCGKAARACPAFETSEGAHSAKMTPDSRAVGILFAGPIKAAPLNPQHLPTKVAHLRNLGDGSSVSQSAGACFVAKAGMPTNCTFNEFILVMLH
jgi:hypothetical protein